MKNLLILLCFLHGGLTLKAQATLGDYKPDSTKNGPDNLFGFNGKKKNDSTLVTTSGSIVTYHQSDNQISVQLPPGGDPFKKMEDEWNNTDKDAEKDAASFLKQVQYAPIATALINAYKQVKDEYKPIVNYRLQLPTEAETQDMANKDFAQNMLAACPKDEADYNEALDFIKKHQHDQTFNAPPPPSMDYENCWSCHPSKEAQFETLTKNYIDTVFKEETKLVAELVGMAEQRNTLGMNDGIADDAFGQTLLKVLGSKRNPTPCYWMWDAHPFKAAQEITYIAFRKADYLFRLYSKDFHRLQVVVEMLLHKSSEYCFLTGQKSPGDDAINEAGNAVSYFCSLYNERLFLKEDFTQWPNMQFLLTLARQCAILGQQTVGETVLEDFQKYDRFKLSMDVDVKIGKDGGYEMAHLQGDNYVSWVPDEDTLHCLRLVMSSDDANSLSQDTKNTELKIKLLNAQMVASGPVPKFVGPYEWQTASPTLIFNSCDNQKDSMSVNPFILKILEWKHGTMAREAMYLLQ